MSLTVSKRFSNNFLLNEVSLRRIEQILKNRLGTLQHVEAVTYKVYRVDGVIYETPTIQKIIEEGNFEWQKIKEIVISVETSYRSEARFSLQIDFDYNGATMKAQGQDEDLVRLISNELEQYISNEVCILRGLPDITLIFAGLLGILLIVSMTWFVLFLVSMSKNPQQTVNPLPEAKDLLKTNDMNEKLNYLISIQLRKDSSSIPLSSPTGRVILGGISLSFFLIVGLFSSNGIKKVLEPMFPINVFLFGKEIDRFKRAKKLRQNMFWGVVIAFIVGVVSSLVVWFFTK